MSATAELDHSRLASAMAAVFGVAALNGADTAAIANNKVARFAMSDARWQPFGDGSYCPIYRSEDGRHFVALLRESGRFKDFVFPFNEAMCVFRGTYSMTVQGGETIVLKAGDVAFIPQGTVADLDVSDDFEDFAYLYSSDPIEL